MAAPILEVLNLDKSYGATVALKGVSFQVAEGEIFGLLGPNGAGKTTLLSIVSCLLEASDGEARIRGQKVNRHRRLGRLPGFWPPRATPKRCPPGRSRQGPAGFKERSRGEINS